MSQPIVLDVQDVHRAHSTTPAVHALRGVTLGVREGELVSVVRPSGSGKSTLLHLMGTLDRPSRGEIVADGFEAAAQQAPVQ